MIQFGFIRFDLHIVQSDDRKISILELSLQLLIINIVLNWDNQTDESTIWFPHWLRLERNSNSITSWLYIRLERLVNDFNYLYSFFFCKFSKMKTGSSWLFIAAFCTTIHIKSLYFSSLFIDRILTKFYTCLPRCVSVCVSVGIVSLGASDENAIVCVLR